MRAVTLAAAAAVLAACSVKTGTEFNPDIIDQIVVGTTTKKEVNALLGQPGALQMLPDGEWWTYSFGRTDIRGSTFIPYANMFHNQQDVSSTNLQIQFNRAGVVRDCSLTSNKQMMVGGFAHMNDSRHMSTATGRRCGEQQEAQEQAPPQDASAPSVRTKKSR